VVHYDFDTIGLKLLAEPGDRFNDRFGSPPQSPPQTQLKVMVLLNAGAGIKIVKPHCD
jgi:hypothetical protein